MITFQDHQPKNRTGKSKLKNQKNKLQEQSKRPIFLYDANMIPLNLSLKDKKREEEKEFEQRNSKPGPKQRAVNHRGEPLLMDIPKSQPLHLDHSPSSPPLNDLLQPASSPLLPLKSPFSSTKKERTLTIDTHSHLCPSTLPVVMSPVANIQSQIKEDLHELIKLYSNTRKHEGMFFKDAMNINMRNCFSILRTVPKLFDN